jgi:hypothetical protein
MENKITKNEAIIKAIENLLLAYHEPDNNTGDLKYLIGQLIRKYDIPADNCHVSKAAMVRWNELTSNGNIKDFHYKDKVICCNLENDKDFILYKGASKEGDIITLSKNDSFEFRQMFHEDHVIPVSMIFAELKKSTDIKSDKIKCILDKMHLCIILKEEDRKIGRTKGRSMDFDKTISHVYKEAEICIAPDKPV